MSNGFLPMPTQIVVGSYPAMTVVAYTEGGVQADKVRCRDISQAVRATRKHRTGSIDNREDIVIRIIDNADIDWQDKQAINTTLQVIYAKKNEGSLSGPIWNYSEIGQYLVGEQALEDVDGQEEVTRELTFHVSSKPSVTPEA